MTTTQSPWTAEPAPELPPLADDIQVDVAIAGGGIVGVTAALMLARAGASVALVEAHRIGMGVTGHTTAKLSSLHALTYDSLRRKHGLGAARAYAEANEAGIASISRFVDELGIDCDLGRKPNYTYVEAADSVDAVVAEVEAMQAVGLPAEQVSETDLPYPIAAAVRLGDQAEFHPYRYTTAIAAAASEAGARIFERARAVSLRGSVLRTAGGASVEAERVIVATHIPFLDRGLYFARTHAERSYAIGLRIGDAHPGGMYISADGPTRSIRSHVLGGKRILIVGGESHRVGDGSEGDRYERLERWARELWQVESVTHRWSAQDNMPVDGLPYVGELSPGSDRVLCATGLRKWGLAMGASAGEMLAEQALGGEPRWDGAFSTRRLNPAASARELLSHNAVSGLHFFADRLTRRAGREGIQPGKGRVVGTGAGQAAVYRDEQGVLHAHSARCTHLGCIVNWNAAEKSWDCPCHGSRFSALTGEVIQGPAVAALDAEPAVGE